MTSRSSTIIDPIYDRVPFNRALNVVGHHLFQLLKGKQQLGQALEVFPSGSITRQAHSFGVAYIVLLRMSRLLTEGKCTEQDVQNAYLAGLLHDIGHWPLSHLPEAILGSHSKRGIRLILSDLREAIIADGGQPEVIVEILESKHWLSPLVVKSIVSGDKIDYMARDVHHISGENHSILKGFRVDYIGISPENGIYVDQRYINEVTDLITLFWSKYIDIYYDPPLRAVERFTEQLIWLGFAAIPELREEAEYTGDSYLLGSIQRFAYKHPESELAIRQNLINSRKHPFIGYCFSMQPDAAIARSHQRVVKMDKDVILRSSRWTPEEVTRREHLLANALNVDPWQLSICSSPDFSRWSIPKLLIRSIDGTYKDVSVVVPALKSVSEYKTALGCTILVNFASEIHERMVSDKKVQKIVTEIITTP